MNATRSLASICGTLILATLVACGGGSGDTSGSPGGGNPGGGNPGGGGNQPAPSGGGQFGSGPDPAPDPSGSPTSNDLINTAVTGGQLTIEQALIYKMFAEFGDPRLPAQYAGDDGGFIEGDAQHQVVAHIANVGINNVSPATLDTLRPFFVPPYYEGSWWHKLNPGATTVAAPRDRAAAAGSDVRIAAAGNPNCRAWESGCSLLADWKSVGGTNVVVWYLAANEATDAAKAAMLVQEFDGTIWPELTGVMGRVPKSDVGTGLVVSEADGRLDVILVDMSGNKEGSTYPSTISGCKAVPTHIYLNRNLSNQGLIAQAAHEFMHSIQFSIPVVASCLEDYYTTQEATAVWATNRVYPANNWEQKYAKHYLKGGWVSEPYDHRPGQQSLFRYGAYVFPLFLQTRFGDSIVKAIWDKTTQYNQELFAIDSALGDAGSSFHQEWPKFIAANWNRETIKTYRDADGLTDQVDLNGDDTLTLSGGTAYVGHDVAIKHAAAAYFRVVFSDSTSRSITIVNGMKFRAGAENQTGFGDNIFFTGLGTLDRQGASLQVFLKVNGAWLSAPSDLSNVPWFSICRDDPAGKIDEMIFMYGNSEFSTGAPNYLELVPRDKNPGVLATSIGCRDWSGGLTMTKPLTHGTEKLTITNVKLTNALPTAAPAPGPGPTAYPFAAGQQVSPGFGWVYRIAGGSAKWTYNDDGDGCTRAGSKTFEIKGPSPVITTSAFAPPGALSRGIVIPGLMANVVQTVVGLSYDWRCVDSNGEVTTGTTVNGTDLDIVAVINDPAVRVTVDGLTVGGTQAQSGAGSSANGSWLLQGATQ